MYFMSRINGKIMGRSLAFLPDIKRIAVIGASARTKYFFLRAFTSQFKGETFAIKPGADHIEGFPNTPVYARLKDVPGSLDFVFISLPREKVPEVIRECAEKGVKLASVFTADFSDEGTEEGRALEKELPVAAGGVTRILGPNGMGFYYPRIGLAWRPNAPLIVGKTTFIAQSGGISNLLIFGSGNAGLGLSKVFSFGNGVDLHFVELFDFAVHDPETEIIAAYMEGIRTREVPQFRELLAENEKPFIVIKGGKSNAGSRATISHTASLSGSSGIWLSLLKQYGAIQVEHFEDLMNVALVLDAYGPCKMEKTAVVSMSGGFGIIMTDLLEDAGMTVPPFSESLTKKLEQLITIPGTTARNPVDFSSLIGYPDTCRKIFEAVFEDPDVDTVMFDLQIWYLDPNYQLNQDAKMAEKLADAFALAHKYHKPFLLVSQYVGFVDAREKLRRLLGERHLPIFGTVAEAVRAMAKINEWIAFRERKGRKK